MMRRLGFTMIELIFVIVVMGIIGKFGVEFLAQAYRNFIFSSINNTLQAQSEVAVETIATRLQFRIKDSIIARQPGANLNNFKALAGSDYAETATILEWVGTDIENYRGDSLPNWSGIIDLNTSTTKDVLQSPGTNTAKVNTLIKILSNSGSDVNDTAIFFIGADSDIDNYGWDGDDLDDHNTSVMHPINSTSNPIEFVSGITGVNFFRTDIYEYYQLAWTAYAVEHNATTGDLILHYDYQPWNGESYLSANTKSSVLMENVSTFRFKAVGSVVKIQVCVNSDVVEDYSLCKEKTIF